MNIKIESGKKDIIMNPLVRTVQFDNVAFKYFIECQTYLVTADELPFMPEAYSYCTTRYTHINNCLYARNGCLGYTDGLVYIYMNGYSIDYVELAVDRQDKICEFYLDLDNSDITAPELTIFDCGCTFTFTQCKANVNYSGLPYTHMLKIDSVHDYGVCKKYCHTNKLTFE